MSLEARVEELEENRVHWDQILTGIEGTVALILREQMEQCIQDQGGQADYP